MASSSSFLPEDYLEKRTQRRTNLICVSLFCVVMLGVVGAYFAVHRRGAQMRARLVEVNHRFEEAAKRLDQLEELQGRKQQMVHKAKVTAALLERVPRTL